MSKKDRKELSEDEATQIVLKSHPQWRKQWENDKLPDELIGEDGEPMNPQMHIAVHVIVERQLAADEPKGVVAIAKQLEQLGMSRHDVCHTIGHAITGQIWSMQKEGRPFDAASYLAELREMVGSYERENS